LSEVVMREREQEMLGRGVLVLELLRFALGRFDEVARLARKGDLDAALLLGQAVERLGDLAGDALRIGADLLQERRDQPALLLGEREEDVLGQHLRLAGTGRQILRSDERFTGFYSELVQSHDCLAT
jgi:hypothetical protein